MDKRPAFLFIIITLVIDAMGIGLIIPVMPELMKTVAGVNLSSAAVWGGFLATIFAVMQFLFGPTVGSLSDKYGRRPILLISMAVIAVDYVIMGFANSIWLLVVLRIVAGIAASTQVTAAAYISDISSPEQKIANFGILGAAFGIGFVLGPLVGGVLGDFDYRAPFFASAALATLSLIFGYFVLPETLTDETRRPFDLSRSNPVGALVQIRRFPGMMRLLVLFFLYDFAFNVYPAAWSYFTIARFGWSESMLGLSLALFGISIAVVQGFLIRKVVARYTARQIILFGFVFDLVIFVVLAFITSGTWTLILTPIAALGALVVPSLQGVIARMADDNQQGEIQGIISSVRALSVIAAPLVMTSAFFWGTREGAAFFLPGAPFLVSAAVVVVCLAIFWRPGDVDTAKR